MEKIRNEETLFLEKTRIFTVLLPDPGRNGARNLPQHQRVVLTPTQLGAADPALALNSSTGGALGVIAVAQGSSHKDAEVRPSQCLGWFDPGRAQ